MPQEALVPTGNAGRCGYRLSIWSALWMCGNEPGEHGLAAQAKGYLVPGPRLQCSVTRISSPATSTGSGS